MKNLKRNERPFTYKAFKSKTEIVKDGKRTGKMQIQYENPIPYTGNISVPNGQATQELFGINTQYTHVLIMDNPNLDIREDGLIECNGRKYEVKAARPSLNVLAIALKECVG